MFECDEILDKFRVLLYKQEVVRSNYFIIFCELDCREKKYQIENVFWKAFQRIRQLVFFELQLTNFSIVKPDQYASRPGTYRNGTVNAQQRKKATRCSLAVDRRGMSICRRVEGWRRRKGRGEWRYKTSATGTGLVPAGWRTAFARSRLPPGQWTVAHVQLHATTVSFGSFVNFLCSYFESVVILWYNNISDWSINWLPDLKSREENNQICFILNLFIFHTQLNNLWRNWKFLYPFVVNLLNLLSTLLWIFSETKMNQNPLAVSHVIDNFGSHEKFRLTRSLFNVVDDISNTSPSLSRHCPYFVDNVISIRPL